MKWAEASWSGEQRESPQYQDLRCPKIKPIFPCFVDTISCLAETNICTARAFDALLNQDTKSKSAELIPLFSQRGFGAKRQIPNTVRETKAAKGKKCRSKNVDRERSKRETTLDQIGSERLASRFSSGYLIWTHSFPAR